MAPEPGKVIEAQAGHAGQWGLASILLAGLVLVFFPLMVFLLFAGMAVDRRGSVAENHPDVRGHPSRCRSRMRYRSCEEALMPEETSLSLLERLARGSEDADWRRLVAVYTPLLRRWLERYLLQPSDRDDLLQDVLTTLVRELPAFRHSGQQGAFRRWLRTVLTHRVRHFWRRKRARPLALGDPDFQHVLDQLAQPESDLSRQWDREHDEHVVARLLEQIRPDFETGTWEAFRRYALDNRPAADVAGELGLTTNAVCIAKSRVLSRLRVEARGLID
jgi:RNA polymerase sigma-70 factor (ECF subfamily)